MFTKSNSRVASSKRQWYRSVNPPDPPSTLAGQVSSESPVAVAVYTPLRGLLFSSAQPGAEPV